ncbi:MAG: 3-hydroxyacyl-CoA dehydrogenase, partial [Phycisphaerae bacterium]|nr:3-hydroxyacyl-CoA dehydrogenase [Gemmatimonadaceae bacterium]
MRVTTVGVIGAGAMGSGIAALAASAGCRVVLLDIAGNPDPKHPDRSGPARNGLLKATKSKPASFMYAGDAARVRTGNTEDHLELLAECDWICEAIIELAGPKQELFKRIEVLMKPTAIVTSNTSGIPMSRLLEGRAEKFRRRFLGTHFFNPPRYMHLLEIIPTPETDPAVIGAMRQFAERVLGKGIVIAKDVPGFIANRLGVYGMVATMRRMEEHGLTIDEVDGLTGSLIGRARSATFRTGDLSGIDVMAHVTKGIGAATGEDFSIPAWMAELVTQGKLGDKTGAGFYQKTKEGILTFDWKNETYVPQQRLEGGDIGAAIRMPIPQRLQAARAMHGKHGVFLRDHLVDVAHYTLMLADKLGNDIVSIDRAMEWGYGWEAGPFHVMDALGLGWLEQEFDARGLPVPALLERAVTSFYKDDTYLTFDGTYEPIPQIPGRISLTGLSKSGRVVEDTGLSRLIDLGDGVLCFEFRSKMNTMGEGLLKGLESAIAKISRGGYAGLVIGNEDPRTFSAGADLSLVS